MGKGAGRARQVEQTSADETPQPAIAEAGSWSPDQTLALRRQNQPGGGNAMAANALAASGQGPVAEHNVDLRALASGVDLVTGTADLGQIAPTAAKLSGFATQVIAVATLLAKKGKEGDSAVLSAAATLTDLATKTNEAVGQLQKLSNGGGEVAGWLAKNTGHLSNLLKSADLVANLGDNAMFQKFEANPEDFESACAWAMQAAGTFDAAGKLIPPGVENTPAASVFSMWRGLMSAPKSYVKAFLSHMSGYLKKADAAAGFEEFNPKMMDGIQVIWGGQLTDLVSRAPNGLYNYMKSPKATRDNLRSRVKADKGVDLFKCSKTIGQALVISDVQANGKKKGATDEDVASWVDYLMKG